MDAKTIFLGSTDPNPHDQEAMTFLLECQTDIGTTRKSNQDACCVRIIHKEDRYIAMAAVCDGVGGLSNGEYASQSTVQSLNAWFDEWTSKKLQGSSEELLAEAKKGLDRTVREQNQILYEYGQENGIKLGTTLTLMFFLDDRYLIVQIGDSRAYCIKSKLNQLTEDQSLVAREVSEGRLTPEEAAKDSRRNIILQCIGGEESIMPVFQMGNTEIEATYFLCSDGLFHELSENELEEMFSPQSLIDRGDMRKAMLEGIEQVKQRGERDNITIVLVRTNVFQ